MADYEFIDALTSTTLAFGGAGEGVALVDVAGETSTCSSLFAPGCSIINYGMPLVAALYDTLRQDGQADGITFVCCGKILHYEPDGEERAARHAEDFRAHLLAAGVQRIVCACPNCVKTLADTIAADERTASIELAALPQVMADQGYRIDPTVVARIVTGDENATVRLCTHDSCPDRKSGMFADGLRALMPDELWVDPAHCRNRSICCGSLARAAGHFDVADKQALQNGAEALEVQADCLVTSCVSCAFQLNMAQDAVPARFAMEFLYDWPIDWDYADQYMKLRFLFTDEVSQDAASGRAFQALESETIADQAADVECTVEEAALEAGELDAASREDFEREERLSASVSISNRDVETLGE